MTNLDLARYTAIIMQKRILFKTNEKYNVAECRNKCKDYFGDTAHFTDFFCCYYFANGRICIIKVSI